MPCLRTSFTCTEGCHVCLLAHSHAQCDPMRVDLEGSSASFSGPNFQVNEHGIKAQKHTRALFWRTYVYCLIWRCSNWSIPVIQENSLKKRALKEFCWNGSSWSLSLPWLCNTYNSYSHRIRLGIQVIFLSSNEHSRSRLMELTWLQPEIKTSP